VGSVSRALRIRAGEQRTTALIVALMFVSMSGIAIGESGINALFFDRIGTRALPLMYLAQAGSMLVAMFVLTAVLGRVGHRMIYLSSPVLLAAVVLAERTVLLTEARWIYPVLWVTVAFAMLAQGIGLWGTAGTVIDTRQAKRLFPIFGAGGILGSVVGGLLTRPLASAVGAENLLLVWAGGLMAAFALCRLVLGPAGTTVRPSAAHRGGSPLRDIASGFAFVRRSRLLVAMAAAAVLFSVLFYSLFLPFATAATERFPEADQLAGFFGLVWATVTGAAFLLSMLLTNRLFAWFGVAAMVLVLPLLYTGSFGTLLVESGLVTIVALRILTGVWLQGVASPAWETLVNVVPDDRRDQTRAFLNGGPAQVGTAIAGVVALVGQNVLTPRQFAVIGLVASLLTLAAALSIRGSYANALLDALRAGRPQVFERPAAWTPMPLAVDAEAGRVLERSMRSDDVVVRRLAFQLGAELASEALADDLIAGSDDPDAIVRLAAVRAIPLSSPAGRQAVLWMVDDVEPAVAAAASARALGTAGDTRASGRLAQLLRDGAADVRRSALDQLSLAPPGVAADMAERLLADPAPRVRASALERLAAAAPERTLEPSLAGMRDADPAVRIAAGRALGAAGPRAIEHVLSALADPRTTDAGVEAARRVHADGEAEPILAFVSAAATRARDDHDLAAAIPSDGEAEALLRDAIMERGRRVARSALWAATMLATRRDAMETAIENLDGPGAQLANALETLETAGDPALVRPLLSLWERAAPVGADAVDWLTRALADNDATIRRCADLVRARREGVTMSRSTTIPLIERVLFLRQVPLFADLEATDLERVAEIAEERGFADGETIAAEGELGDELHIVIEGTIRVVQDRGGSEHELARRTAGDVVGEMSLLTRMPRMASLVADGIVRAIRIGYREFESMLRERPDVALGVMRVLAQRLAEERP